MCSSRTCGCVDLCTGGIAHCGIHFDEAARRLGIEADSVSPGGWVNFDGQGIRIDPGETKAGVTNRADGPVWFKPEDRKVP